MRLYTIGHSNHSIEQFLRLLSSHSITCVCDVRSNPYSRYAPQFNRETFEQSLKSVNVRYAFMGDQLGGRSRTPSHYVGGRVQYNAVAASASFQDGLGRLRHEAAVQKVCLMCTEKDPMNCHRAILVSRHLRDEMEILHILADGTVETNAEFEERLRASLNIPAQDLFEDYATLINRAYDLQGKKIAFSATPDTDLNDKD